MSRLEELTRDALVQGILPDGAVTVVDARWHGGDCVELAYKAAAGQIAHEVRYRDDEPRLAVEAAGRPWAFDGDGDLFRLVAEAQRIRLAYPFDPLLADHTSVVEPLPHQITAVYERGSGHAAAFASIGAEFVHGGQFRLLDGATGLRSVAVLASHRSSLCFGATSQIMDRSMKADGDAVRSASQVMIFQWHFSRWTASCPVVGLLSEGFDAR